MAYIEAVPLSMNFPLSYGRVFFQRCGVWPETVCTAFRGYVAPSRYSKKTPRSLSCITSSRLSLGQQHLGCQGPAQTYASPGLSFAGSPSHSRWTRSLVSMPVRFSNVRCNPHQGYGHSRFHSVKESSDPYKVLGLERNATLADIKKRYRELAKKHHPDMNPNKNASTDMANISAAYDQLVNPQRQQPHHNSHNSGPHGHPFPSGSGFNHTGASFKFYDFNNIFGDAFGSFYAQGGPIKRGDSGIRVTEVTLSFLDAVKGCTKPVLFRVNAKCPTCNGTGASPGSKLSPCGICDGDGIRKQKRGSTVFGSYCSSCEGTGKIVSSPCTHCKGKRVVPTNRTINVEFSPGIRHGVELCVANQPHPGVRTDLMDELYVKVNVEEYSRCPLWFFYHGCSGMALIRAILFRDVILGQVFKNIQRDIVNVKPDPTFNLVYDDIHVLVPLTLKQVFFGGRVRVPTLEGLKMLTLPPGTSPGSVKVLKGKGMKKMNSGSYGDLVVEWTLDIPKQLTEEQKHLITEFDKLEQGKAGK